MSSSMRLFFKTVVGCIGLGCGLRGAMIYTLSVVTWVVPPPHTRPSTLLDWSNFSLTHSYAYALYKIAFVILEQYQSFAMRFANLVWDY